MFLDAAFGLAKGLSGGGSAPGGPVRASQDGNALTSGTGDFNFGGPPKWFWPVLLGGLALGGFLLLKRK